MHKNQDYSYYIKSSEKANTLTSYESIKVINQVKSIRFEIRNFMN